MRPVDILVITHNRRAYVERTLSTLFADPTEFHVYMWDNASTDGARELVDDCDDPRIMDKHFSDENVMQEVPTRWLLDVARSDVIGKVDDDTLVPAGWTALLASAVRAESRLGMVGCWTFRPEDFERNRAAADRKVITVGSHRILADIYIAGTASLMRRDVAIRYLTDKMKGRAFPIDRYRMTWDGFISGWYFPLLFAEHMDDPRSEYSLMRGRGPMDEGAALTARTRGFETPEQFVEWLKADVDHKMARSLRRQSWEARWERAPWSRAWRFATARRGPR